VPQPVADVTAQLPVPLKAPYDDTGRYLDLAGEGLDLSQRDDPSQLGVVASRDEEAPGKRIRLELLGVVDVAVIDKGQALPVE
jgi:hypothetical protein